MRRLVFVAFVALAVPSIGTAAPLCVAGTLASYEMLGTDGCTIGAHTVADVTVGSLLPDATPIGPEDVLVTPASGPGLSFGLDATVGPGDLLDLLIRFTLAGPPLGSAELALIGATASGDGNVTAVQDACVGGAFGGSDPTTSCPGTLSTLIVVRDANELVSPASSLFAGSSFFDVFVEITLDGGLDGGASLGTVTTRFGAGEDQVPEPTAIVLLTAAAVVGLRHTRRVVRA